MGLFDMFRKADFRTAADAISRQALDVEATDVERDFVATLGIDFAAYIKERNLMRVGVSGAGVAFFWSKSPMQRPLQDLSYHLNELYRSFFAEIPGSDVNEASAVMRHIERTYLLEDPQVIAARLLQNITQGRTACRDPLLVAPFVEIVRELMKGVLLTVGNQTKKITE